MKFNKYYLSALIAFIIWGFFSLALKPLHDYPSLDILFYRVFFSTTVLLIINFVFRINLLKKSLELFRSGKTNLFHISKLIRNKQGSLGLGLYFLNGKHRVYFFEYNSLGRYFHDAHFGNDHIYLAGCG